MKHWTIICALGLAPILWAGCGQETAKAPAVEKAVTSPGPISTIPVNGYRKKVFAIGHPFLSGPSTEWELYEEFTYDSAGHETEYLAHFDGMRSRVVTQYDPEGYVLLATHTNSKNAERLEHRSTWTTDHTTQSTELYSHVEGRVVAKTTRKFDSARKLLSIEEEDLHLPDLQTKTRLTYVYNSAQQLLEQREVYQGTEILGLRNTYDPAGNCIKVEHFDAEGHPSQVEFFAFDGTGHKTSYYLQDFSAFNKTKQLKAKYEYDPKGNLIRELHFEGECDSGGEANGKCLIGETITTTYDPQGRVLNEDRERAHAEPAKLRKRFEYEVYTPSAK